MKKKPREKKADERQTRGRWAIVPAGLFILVMSCVLFYFVYGGKVSSSDFEGIIVDRYAETQQGPPRLTLVVQSSDGKRLTVKVDPTVYESARVGMRIRSRSGQIVLIDSQSSK